jgi:anhydro-N-acetylmuramic acid kinase
VFGAVGQARAVLNLGGIANITLIDAGGTVAGFDTGPANVLLDGWCARHLGGAYDKDGLWAAAGRVHDDLLTRLLSEPFFALPPPKSTGRDRFNLGWLDQTLASLPPLDPADVQATLAELTARTVADALQCHAPQAAQVLVCGGGAHNGHVMRRLAAALPGCSVETTAAHGIAPTQVEATAFAWLARAFVKGDPGNRMEVTGARGPRVLGALYPR